MQYTPNFEFELPESNDYAAPPNENFTKVDTELAKRPAVDEETGKLPDSVLPLSTAATKATPVDADSLALVDSADSNKTKRLLWSQVKAVLGGRGNSLLLNENFSAPYLVNQRGQSSYSTDGYCIDGWTLFLNSGVTTLTVNPEYITINSVSIGGGINQFLEQTLPSGTYTISIKQSDGTIISKTYGISGTTVTSISGDNPSWGAITLGYYNGRFYFQIIVNAGDTCSISSAKLELGSISTLAYDTPPTPAEQELNRQACMRHFRRIGKRTAYQQFGTGYFSSTTTAIILIPIGMGMRTTPVVTYGGSFKCSGLTVSAIAPSSIADQNVASLSVTVSGATTGQGTTLYAGDDTSAYIDLSAEL